MKVKVSSALENKPFLKADGPPTLNHVKLKYIVNKPEWTYQTSLKWQNHSKHSPSVSGRFSFELNQELPTYHLEGKKHLFGFSIMSYNIKWLIIDLHASQRFKKSLTIKAFASGEKRCIVIIVLYCMFIYNKHNWCNETQWSKSFMGYANLHICWIQLY